MIADIINLRDVPAYDCWESETHWKNAKKNEQSAFTYKNIFLQYHMISQFLQDINPSIFTQQMNVSFLTIKVISYDSGDLLSQRCCRKRLVREWISLAGCQKRRTRCSDRKNYFSAVSYGTTFCTVLEAFTLYTPIERFIFYKIDDAVWWCTVLISEM